MTFLHFARTLGIVLLASQLSGADLLEQGFRQPPPEARIRCYWWWLNSHVTRQSITRDLEGMKSKGYGGAMLVDAGGAEQRGNQQVPAGPVFGSPAWRELFRHAVSEADRLGLEISLNIMSGWNLGGPTVKPEQSAKLVTWSQTQVHGPVEFDKLLTMPKMKEGFYREIAVLAYPLRHGPAPNPRPIQQLQIKASFKEAGFSVPDTTPLLSDLPPQSGEEDTLAGQVQVISNRMGSDGRLRWSVPAGDWEILRFGYTSSGSRVSTSSQGWEGLVIDYLDHNALEQYWRDVIDPILAEVKPYLGKALKYTVTDSWELDGVNWSPRFAQEFSARRHYDITPYLPVFAGRIVDSRANSIRFLNDLRKTVGDLVADEHYSAFAALSARYGMGIHPESGGPHGAPVDALKCLGRSAFPQMEYWAKSPTHRVKDEDRFFVKEAASAAHIYGKTLVGAEGFTTIGPHWQESLWADLKPTFDRAIGEGLNRHIWHTFTSSPAEMGLPGQEYFAGTHFNPNVTWWPQSGAFISYLNRSQFLMQQGKFVADALYYYGDHVPNFVRLKTSDPARVMPGFDYDVTNEEVLLTRLSVKDGWLTLPDGMRYRVLVLPDLPGITLPVLRKVRDLVSSGATVLGRKPERTLSLDGLPSADQELSRIVAELWGACNGSTVREHKTGKGRIVCAGTAREYLLAAQVPPDFEPASASVDYIHRTTESDEIYFVSNQTERATDITALFRTTAKAPEFWDAVSGEIRAPAVYEFTSDGRTRLPLHLPPYGSMFVLFRNPAGMHLTSLQPGARAWLTADHKITVESAFPGTYEAKLASGKTITATVPALDPPSEVSGPWQVRFEGMLAVPPARVFDQLRSWTEFQDQQLKYFSGHGTYIQEIEIPSSLLATGKKLLLDLGDVREIAETRLNGIDLGTQWSPPFEVDITKAAKPGKNHLEVRVTNLWANRVIGDANLPPEQRTTRTNITQLKKDTPILPSGLLGPVVLRSIGTVAAK